jgi:sulfur relay (sulfurtransferase) complex TusBCD TusD component (DsrE family)
MKLGIILYSSEPEVVWNAFRLGILARSCEDEVTVFLLAEGVEVESRDTDAFNVSEKIHEFIDSGGKILSCGTCLNLRDQTPPEYCQTGTMGALYDLIKTCDRTVTL